MAIHNHLFINMNYIGLLNNEYNMNIRLRRVIKLRIDFQGVLALVSNMNVGDTWDAYFIPDAGDTLLSFLTNGDSKGT